MSYKSFEFSWLLIILDIQHIQQFLFCVHQRKTKTYYKMACTCNVFRTGKIGQKKSTRKRVVDTTKQYSSTTTIHGISYLASDDTSGVERLLWGIVLLFAIGFTTFQVVTLYNDWQDHPVVTTLDTVALPIEEIKFPAVTICPQGSRKEIIDSVLFRQLKEYIQKRGDNVTVLTPEIMMEQAESFIKDVYPGAKGKPTMLTKMMTSDNPDVSIQNAAILQPEEECDPSSNTDIANELNKQLQNDTCPEGFEMVQGSNYCVHEKGTLMTYDEASKYCDGKSGSNLLYLDTVEDLSSLNGTSGTIEF